MAATLGTVSMAADKQAVLTFDNGGVLGVRVTQAVLQNDIGVDPAVLNSGTSQVEGGEVIFLRSLSLRYGHGKPVKEKRSHYYLSSLLS